MVTVTAVYERDVQGRWLVHIVEEPRCHTWARSSVSARREIMDAAGLWLDELGVESPGDLEIRDEVRIAGAAQARDLAAAREELTRRLTDVRARVDEAARGLVADGVFGTRRGRPARHQSRPGLPRHPPLSAQRLTHSQTAAITPYTPQPPESAIRPGPRAVPAAVR